MSSNNDNKTNTGNFPDKTEDRGLKLPTEPRPTPQPDPKPTTKEDKK